MRVVQLEVTRKRPQTCANVRMLRNLLLLGFDLYKVRACHRMLLTATDCYCPSLSAIDCR